MKEQYYQSYWNHEQDTIIKLPAEEAQIRGNENNDYTEKTPNHDISTDNERVHQMFWIPERGVIITLPPDSTSKIAHGINNGGIPHNETHRLKIISKDSILKKRYPTPEEGSKYMDSVDMQQREYLYSLAQQTSEHIVNHAKEMGKDEIAVVLFGSVAKGLTRSPKDPDKSNIDMAVIGEFTADERDELFDRIRPFRQEKGGEIGKNIGIHIQTTDIFGKNHHDEAFNYIGSGATALYDPHGIWSAIEEEAFDASDSLKRYRSTEIIKSKTGNGGEIRKQKVNGEIVVFQNETIPAAVVEVQ